MISSREEKALVNKTKRGDQESFEKLEALSRKKVTLHIQSILKNSFETEEVYQRALIKAWKKIKSFRGECRFSTWLCQICRNLAYDELRRRNRYPQLSYDNLVETKPFIEELFLDVKRERTGREALEVSELGEKILKTLNKLPLGQKEILTMFLTDGMTYKDIALKLDVSKSTVTSRIFQARKRAQKIYKRIERKEKVGV